MRPDTRPSDQELIQASVLHRSEVTASSARPSLGNTDLPPPRDSSRAARVTAGCSRRSEAPLPHSARGAEVGWTERQSAGAVADQTCAPMQMTINSAVIRFRLSAGKLDRKSSRRWEMWAVFQGFNWRGSVSDPAAVIHRRCGGYLDDDDLARTGRLPPSVVRGSGGADLDPRWIGLRGEAFAS